MYRIRGETPEARKQLFLGIMTRINELHDRPSFYNTLVGNCTTALVGHVNDIVPGKIPMGIEVLLPGLMDETLERLDLLDTDLPIEEAREKASVDELAKRYVNDPEFSKRIRGR
jgi:hypothetical protein